MSEIISPMTGNCLFWLGRYVQRICMTLHLLRKCYDTMIDGEMEDYDTLWKEFDPLELYPTEVEFRAGMLYDEANAGSVISSITRAMDNAILLRGVISSETLSYIEMSMAKIKECKEKKEHNINHLQTITDWSLAFWGSAEQRLTNHDMLNLLMMGRNVENIDMMVRFGYPAYRLVKAYESFKKYADEMETYINHDIDRELKDKLVTHYSPEGRHDILSLLCSLVKV